MLERIAVYTLLYSELNSPVASDGSVYTVSQKTVQNYFCQNFVKFQPTVNIFLAYRWQMQAKTRMVQLPATAAIEYVAACWVSGPGGFLSGGAFVRGVFCPGDFFLGGLCPFPPSSMRIRTV